VFAFADVVSGRSLYHGVRRLGRAGGLTWFGAGCQGMVASRKRRNRSESSLVNPRTVSAMSMIETPR
jgi:hypothetical protein